MSDRLYLGDSRTADANGSATFTFGPAQLGYVWSGSIAIPSASPSSMFSVTVGSAGGGTPWGGWTGPAPSQLVQAWAGETMTVVATGLVPGQGYSAVLTGRSEADYLAEPLIPQPTTPGFTERFIGSFQVSGPSSSFNIFGLQPSDHFLRFAVIGDPCSLTSPSFGAFGAVVVSQKTTDFISVLPVLAPAITVAWTPLGVSPGSSIVDVYATPVEPTSTRKVRRSLYSTSVAVGPHPIIVAPALVRLVSISIAASAAGATAIGWVSAFNAFTLSSMRLAPIICGPNLSEVVVLDPQAFTAVGQAPTDAVLWEVGAAFDQAMVVIEYEDVNST